MTKDSWFQDSIILSSIILGVFFLLVPFAVNFYFQRKAARYADELLSENAAEYNGQIKTTAVTSLIRRSLWGLYFLAGIILSFQTVWEQGFRPLTVIVAGIGIGCFVFGVWDFRVQMKRLKK